MRPLVGGAVAADDVHEGGLAGAVGAHEPDDLAAAGLDGDAVEGDHAAEAHDDVAARSATAATVGRRQRLAAPSRPPHRGGGRTGSGERPRRARGEHTPVGVDGVGPAAEQQAAGPAGELHQAAGQHEEQHEQAGAAREELRPGL